MAWPYTQRQAMAFDAAVKEALNSTFKTRDSLAIFERKAKRKVMGLNLRVPVIMGNAGNAQAYANYDVLGMVPNTTHRAVQYLYRNRYDAIQISGDERRENAGEPQILDIIEAKAMVLKDSMGDNLATDLFGTTDGLAGAALGLRRILTPSTSDVGGLDSNDIANWAAQVDASTTALTLQKLQNKIRACRVRGAKPGMQVIFTTPEILDKISAGILGANVLRVADKDSVSAGFSDVSVLGVPIVIDEHCPGTGAGTDDSHLFIDDLEAHQYWVHPDQDMRVADPSKYIYDQDVVARQVFHTYQWICRRRWSIGGFSVLDPGE